MLKREEVSILNIIFEKVHHDNEKVSIQTISTETLEFVFSLYRIKTREGFPLKFSFKGKQLDPKLSLVDAGLSDNSIIITELPVIDFDILEPYIILFIQLLRSRIDIRTLSFQLNPNMLVRELISLFKFISGETSECIFIFNSRVLLPEKTLAHSGLVNGSKIIAFTMLYIFGAGYPRWDYKSINIKFIKISKSIDTNTNIFNCELTSLLKLCLLKEISSKFNFFCLDKKKICLI